MGVMKHGFEFGINHLANGGHQEVSQSLVLGSRFFCEMRTELPWRCVGGLIAEQSSEALRSVVSTHCPPHCPMGLHMC